MAESSSPAGEDTVFRSPRMIELLRIAERLAARRCPSCSPAKPGPAKKCSPG